ncbi:MAG: tyrosine-type recombinase/integrase [Rhizobacter sp.]|nr:tyrosine-type recombinase/integrase [Rhizobacter sp.]
MGQQTRGIYPEKDGTWQVDKWWRHTRLRQRGFVSFEEAERWLIKELEKLRAIKLHGERPERLFSEAAAYYLLKHKGKPSLVNETYHLKSVMPTIGHLPINQVHDGTLEPHVTRRLAEGRKHKTVNLELGIVRRVLNLCATVWRHENGHTWLDQAPHITMLPLVGHQRDPQPISWPQQRQLLPKLPAHLARMSLFVLNTGARDDVVCSLSWEWEIRIPELGISVFEVPAVNVKGRKRSRLLVCNSVAQSVIEAVRGQHPELVFVYQRLKRDGSAGKAKPHGIETMNNTAWQRARQEAGLGDLHVHDLRHTTGMRLREAGVSEATVGDILWHTSRSMTHHYSMAQIVELHAALDKIKDDTGRWNKSLATLRLEQEAARAEATPPKVPDEKKTA